MRRGADRPPAPLTCPDISPRLLFSEVQHALTRPHNVDGIKENLTAKIYTVHFDAMDDRFCNF